MLDITKPVTTRDGRPARIISTDMMAKGGRRIVAITHIPGTAEEQLTIHNCDGRRTYAGGETPDDLVNYDPDAGGVKWINIWTTGADKNASTYSTRADADEAARLISLRGQKRLACVSVSWKAGEGLDVKS